MLLVVSMVQASDFMVQEHDHVLLMVGLVWALDSKELCLKLNFI